MKNSKTWKPNEDQALITLHKDRNITKWTTISKLLHQQFGFKGKTPKKCRQRFKNHLNPNINRQDWTENEQKKLLDLQNNLGNRWAQISRKLPGRTDNSVKNKFFSKYRRALRKLNILLQKRKINGFKQIQIGFLYKLINLIDNKFKGDLNIDDQLVKEAEALKQAIIQFQNITVEEYQLQQKELDFFVTKIQYVNSQLKRKAGKRKKTKVSINVIQEINKAQTMAKLNTDDAIDTPRKEENLNPVIYLSDMLKKPASPYLFRSLAREKEEERIEDQDNYRQSRLIIGRWGEEQEQSQIWKLPIYGHKDSQQYF